jgi:cobaltochelatase CobT
VRERLTGLAPPPAAKKLVDMWRPWVEDRAGRNLDRLGRLLEDQRRFGDAIRDLLDSLDMGEDRARYSDEGDDDRDQEANPDEAGEQGEAQESDDAQGMSLEEAEISADELPEGATEAVDAPTADMPDDAEMGEAETANEPWRPRRHGMNEPRGPDYRPFTAKFDEVVAAEELCEPEELDRLRSYLDKQLSHLQGVVARLANRLQRLLLAQQNRAWEFDLEESFMMRRVCRASSSTRCTRCRSSARGTPSSATR